MSVDYATIFLINIGQFVGVEEPVVALAPSGNVALSWELADGRRALEVEVLDSGMVRFAYTDFENESEDAVGTTDFRRIVVLLTQ